MATTTNSNFFHQPPLPPARTPLPASKPGEASIKQNEDQHIAIITSESLEIQVPSTQSPSGSIHEEEMSPRPSSPRKGEPDHLSSVDRTDVAEDEDQTVRTPKVDHNANLPAMNWAEFEARFATAQDQASTAEDELFDEFDKLAVVFGNWINAANKHDNERAIKRIRTRERFVQLSEEQLEKKKKHHIEVVTAFRNAVQMLERRP